LTEHTLREAKTMSLNQVPPPNETGGNGAGATNAGLGGLDMGMSPELLLNQLKTLYLSQIQSSGEGQEGKAKLDGGMASQFLSIEGIFQGMRAGVEAPKTVVEEERTQGEAPLQEASDFTMSKRKDDSSLNTSFNLGKKHQHSRSLSSGSLNGNLGSSTAEKVRRTVYVADVHYQVTEDELAKFFAPCGAIVDYRICGDTNTVLRFAFIEFRSEEGAKEALKLTGSILGECAIRVSPSKTAIIPVKDQFLPRSEREREAVARTVYVANIHQTVERDVLRQFFQMVCGPVSKIRLLGDAQHDTKIAFVEFVSKDSMQSALRCTGAMLGPLAIRVSPSKTPVRTDARRRTNDQSHLPADAVTIAAKLSKQLKSNNRGNHSGNKIEMSSKGAGSGKQQPQDVQASPTILSLLEGILSD
jgi:RNA recognition motif-containing protein